MVRPRGLITYVQRAGEFGQDSVVKVCDGGGMFAGELRIRIDAIWNTFRAGGIADPIEGIE